MAEYNKQIVAYRELSDDEKIKRYNARIRWAKEATKKARNMAEVYVQYYRNKPQVFTKGGQKVIVPQALKNVDAMFAALTAFHIVPVVAPKGLTTADMARVQEQALRNEWDEQEVMETSEDAIKESLVCGIGFVKVGYEFEEVEEGYEVEGETPEGLATETQTDKVVVKDNVTIEHIPYDELFWDPEAKKWDDVTWVCQKYTVPIEELKGDERYTNTADLKPSAYIDEKWRSGGISKNLVSDESDEQRVVLYEFWDLIRGTICWFAEGNDQILRESLNPFLNRLTFRKRNPFVPFISRSDIGEVWGISDVAAMKPAIDEQNILRSKLATWVERNSPKILADEGVFTEQGKKAMRSQEYGEVVELRKGAVLQQSVRPLEVPTMPQEAFVQDSKAANDADDVVGMTALLGGNLPPGRKTATAMQQLGQAETIRQSEKRNRLTRFYREIADKTLYLMQALYEQDRITRIVEDIGDVVWDWNAEDISFESSVTVDLEPREVLDSATKREKFLALWNLGGQDPYIDPIELRKFVLRDGLGIPMEIVRLLVKDIDRVEQEQQAAAEQEAMAGGPGAGPAEQNMALVDRAMEGNPPTASPAV